MPYCSKCKKTMKDIQFYTYRDGTKTELCKECLTMHIQNDKPETFLWLLEKMDVPYVPSEWTKLYNKAYAKDPNKINGMSVFGKYLSKMRLNQFNKYRWADTEKLQKELEEKNAEREKEQEAINEELKIKYENGEITENEYRTLTSTDAQAAQDAEMPASVPPQDQNFFDESKFISESELPDIGEQLTKQDKIMLAMKWGREYTPAQWVQLEKNYKNFTKTFGVEDPDTENTLILLCKTNLKMNEAVDCGDFEGFNKLSKVYDSLRKTAKFTAAQNKETGSGFVDTIGQLISYCELNGGQIPRYDISVDYDIFDKVINDMKNYTKSLIYEDPALARQIEDYIKRSDAVAQQKKNKEIAEAAGLDSLDLTTDDYIDSLDRIEEERELDNSIEED